MPRFGRSVLALSTAGLLAVVAVQLAFADGGHRSMGGEELLVQDATLTLDCDPARVSTISFSASGIAVGPFPGPFAVEGTVTIAPQTLAGPRPGTVAGPLLTLDETFSIDSPLGTITGAKKLTGNQPFSQSQGSCQHVTNFGVGPVTGGSGTVVDVFSQPRYGAKIDAGGNYHDRGDASFSLSELDLDGTCVTGPCHFRQASYDAFFMSTAPPTGSDHNSNDMDDVIEPEIP